MSKKLNILFLASWYPNKEVPQNGNFIERHAQAVGQFANVAVLYVHSIQDQDQFEVAITENKNIVECRVYFPKTSKFKPWAKLQKYKKAHEIGYSKLLESFKKFDVAHLNVFFPAGVFALHLKKQYGIPYIVTEHWTKFLPIHPAKFSLYERYIIQKTANAAFCICPVSKDLEKAIRPFVQHDRFEVIPNVVNTNLFGLRSSTPKDKVSILHISTLNDAHKNTTGMLNVISKLANIREDFKFTMIGNQYGQKYIDLAQQLNIPDHCIEILPEIPIEEVAAHMIQHDIFMLFSNYENLPCVISESLVSGLSIIASDVGGIREMLDRHNGILVEKGDETALLDGLIHLIDNIGEYNPVDISEKAKGLYSYSAVAKRFITLYRASIN